MKDMRGQRFGRLVAIEPTDQRHRETIVVWRCVCDCGRERLVPGDHLRRGLVRSCGCLQDENRRKDITGQKRGHLTALHATDQRRNGHTVWAWACDCGAIVYKTPGMVGEGQSTMCPACAKALKAQQSAYAASCVERDSTGRSIKQVEGIKRGDLPAHNTSGVRGVSWHAGRRMWAARVSVDGKTKTIGYYKSIDAAAKARQDAIKELYGE